MNTLKSLKELSGKAFEKRVVGVACVEDIPAMEEHIKESLKSQGYDFSTWNESEDSWRFGSQFIMKPKLKRQTSGVVEFRAGGDYTFKEEGRPLSFGSPLKKENLREYGFEVFISGGSIQYHIIP